MCGRCRDIELCVGGAGIRNCGTFLPNMSQFSERISFSRQKMQQSLNCGTLQDGALRRSRQSVAHTVGEKCAHMVPCF